MKNLSLTTLLLLFIQFTFAQNLSLGLQGHYKFNNSLHDNSINNITGINNNAIHSEGLENELMTGYEFNGTNAFLDLSVDNRSIINQLTLSAWIKTTDTKRQFVVSKYNSSEDQGYVLAVDQGFPSIGGRNGNGQFTQSVAQTLVNDGEWHFLLAIIDNNKWEIWVDCELENTVFSNAASNIDLSCSDPLTIGNWIEGNGLGDFRYFNGKIDDVRIYNRPLDVIEIEYLCDIDNIAPQVLIESCKDVYINDIGSGIIMKSPDGKCWRVTIDNTGQFLSVPICCPYQNGALD